MNNPYQPQFNLEPNHQAQIPMQPFYQPQMPAQGDYGNMNQYNQQMNPVVNMQTQGQRKPPKSQAYFLDMIEVEKHIKHCSSELDFNSFGNAIEFIQKAITLLVKNYGSSPYKIGAY